MTNFVTKIKLNWKDTVVCVLCAVYAFRDLFPEGGSFGNFAVSDSCLRKSVGNFYIRFC